MEDFDKRIREKLEEVRPPLPSNAWANFKQLLPLPWYAILWQQYGSWLMGGLLTTGLAGSLFTIYQDKQTIEKLNGEISTLKNTKQILASISPKIIEKWRVDTVYVVQRQKGSEATRQELVAGNNQLADSRQPTADSPKRQQGIEATSSHQLPVASGELVRSQTSEAIGNQQPTVMLSLSKQDSQESQKVTSSQLPATSTQYPVSSSELASNKVADSQQPTANSQQANEATSNQQPTVMLSSSKQDSKTLIAQSQQPIADSQQILEQFKQQFGEDTTKNKNRANKKAFKMPKLYPRVGIETAFSGLKSSEFSPLFEIFLSENFSLSSGVSVHKTQEERYPKLPDFNKATGKDFTERFKPQLPKHDKIEEIEISTSSIRLPINLKYYVPFKKNFSFLFSTGTTLDLSVYQSVKFESYLQGVETYRSFEDKPQPQIFKNLIFGSGIQYQGGRIIGQFYPFFDYTFRKPDYVPKDGGRVGLKAGIWIDLSKK